MGFTGFTLRIGTAIATLSLVAGCSDDSKTIIESGIVVDVSVDSATVDTGNKVTVTADATAGGGSLTFAWSAAAGHFSDPSEASTTWTAPDEAGTFSLSCVVSDGTDAGIGAANAIQPARRSNRSSP